MMRNETGHRSKRAGRWPPSWTATFLELFSIQVVRRGLYNLMVRPGQILAPCAVVWGWLGRLILLSGLCGSQSIKRWSWWLLCRWRGVMCDVPGQCPPSTHREYNQGCLTPSALLTVFLKLSHILTFASPYKPYNHGFSFQLISF